MENWVGLVFCVLGIPFGLGLLIGWIAWGRGRPADGPVVSSRSSRADHEAWLASQLDRQPLASVLTPDQRSQLRYIYAPTADVVPEQAQAAPTSEPDQTPAEPSVIAEAAHPLYDLAPVTAAPEASAAASDRPASPLTPEQPSSPRKVRDPLDPAVLMLYAGALLVVAAGIVYAAYNWADLVAWQKLGLLAAATIAFAATGWFLLGNNRVRQAAETFVAIGALLIPANAIAAWTVVQDRDASVAIIVFLGSAITALAYAAFSVRPGGILYSYGSAIMAWLALGAVPAAVGLHWGWGSPLVILAVAAARAYPGDVPPPLAHLTAPLRTTGVTAMAIATGVGLGGSLDTTSWLGPITLGAATVALAVFADRERPPVWGVLATVAGTLTAASIVMVIDPASAWGWAVPPLGVAGGLLMLGERAPGWLRVEPVRRSLHIEAIIACQLAVAGADDRDWLRVGVLATGVVITALIAWLRDSRWWLLAPAATAGLLWTALAAALDADERWGLTTIVLYATALVMILAAIAWWLDRWSERTARPRWGEPVWLVAGVATSFVFAVTFAEEELLPGDRTWLLIGGVALAFALVALLAAWSTDRPWIRVLAGFYGVASAVFIGLAPTLDNADRLPLVMIVLLAFTGGAALPGRRDTSSSLSRYLAPRHVTDWRLEIPVLLASAGIVLLGMVGLALRYLATTHDGEWSGMPGVRWTWITYTGVFALVALLAGWSSLATTPAISRLGEAGRKATAWALPGASVTFAGLAVLLVVRMQTTAPLAGLVALSMLAWVVLGTAIAASRSPERAVELAPWRWIGLGVGAVAAIYPMLVISRVDAHDFRSLLTVALVSLAGLTGVEAWFRRDRLLATGASGIAMLALMLQISQREPSSILAYSLPLGVYLLALGTLNRRQPSLRDTLLGAGAGVLLVPAFLLAQDTGSLRYLALASGLALTLFLAGIALRLRVLIAAGIIGITLIVLRLLVDAVIALESWVSLLVVGLLLLGGGTASLIWKEALRAQLERLQRGWHDMG